MVGLIIGVVILLIGVVALFTNRKNMARRKRIMATPTTAIAQAPGNSIVEVKGRIVPSEQGVIQAPFSRRPAVWARVKVQQYIQRGRSSYWKTLVEEQDGRHFFIDDGSGQMARVIPQGAAFTVTEENIAGSGAFRDAQQHIEAFLAARGQSSQNFLGFNKRMKYTEEVLQPNEGAFALGPSRRDAGPPVSDGYRMVPSSQLVMFTAPEQRPGANPEFELILSNKTEEALVKSLRTGTIAGIVMLAIGGVSSLLGVADLIFDIF